MVFSLSALWWVKIRSSYKLPDGRDWLRGNWVLFWWAGPCSVNLQSNFPLMAGTLLPPCSLAWGSPVLDFAVTIVDYTLCGTGNGNRLPGLLLPVPLTLRQATVNPHLRQRLPNTHRQVWLSLLWGHCSFLLGPGAHRVLLVPSRSLCFSVLWKFCNQIPLKILQARLQQYENQELPDVQVRFRKGRGTYLLDHQEMPLTEIFFLII